MFDNQLSELLYSQLQQFNDRLADYNGECASNNVNHL
jgi:hypothetical protein